MSAYEAAIELCRAVDTYRVLRRAGRETDTDVARVENARLRFAGLPPAARSNGRKAGKRR